MSEIKELQMTGQRSSKDARTLCPVHSTFCQSTLGGCKPLNWPLQFRGQMKTDIAAPGRVTPFIFSSQQYMSKQAPEFETPHSEDSFHYKHHWSSSLSCFRRHESCIFAER